MGRYKAFARLWGVTERQAKKIVETAPPWFTNRVDNAIDQPSRAAGRFGYAVNPGRPIGAGLKTGGIAVGGGAAVIGGSELYKSYSTRQTAAEENEIDLARAEALGNLLGDESISAEERMEFIKALDDADFFRNTDITPETWMQKLGLEGGLNPVNFFGGGLTGVIVFLVVVWAVVKIARGGS